MCGDNFKLNIGTNSVRINVAHFEDCRKLTRNTDWAVQMSARTGSVFQVKAGGSNDHLSIFHNFPPTEAVKNTASPEEQTLHGSQE